MNYFRAGNFKMELGKHTYIMGILNITPDSFSDGGSYFEEESAVKHALEMQAQGADIIDIGAQSTRPGSTCISPAEEIERLKPVLNRLKAEINVAISVDTYYPQVAQYSLENGASIINDVSGVVEAKMAKVVKNFGAGWIIMHNGGNADIEAIYEDGVVNAAHDFFEQSIATALEMGVSREQLCMDVGIGFGKSHEDNLRLIRDLSLTKIDGVAMLVGASRKRIVGIAANEPEAKKRLAGTIAAHTLAIEGGADIIRVHDVLQAVQSARVTEAILNG